MLIVALILLQLLIFAGLIFIFRRIMTQNVVLATRHLDELSHDYDKKEQELNKQLEEAKLKSQEMLASAQEEAEKLKMEIIKGAEEERDKLIKNARSQADELIQQADKSRNQLISEIEERITKEATNKACELIQEVLPESFKKSVHTHWVEDLIENGFTKLERLHAPQGLKEVRVVSAFSLSEEERRKLSKKIRDAWGEDMALKEEIDPKVVAGIFISIGSLVLDGTFKNKIKEKAQGEKRYAAER
jgi:F-type H+-transporting ATPase subunit b